MTANTSQNTRRARRRCARKARPPEFKPRDARFRLLAEHSNDIFFSMRFPEGRYEFISPCVEKLFGFSPRDFYDDSTTVLRCVAPAWRERVQGWIGEIAQGRVADELEFQVVDRAGRTRWLHQRQVLVPAPDGQGWLLQGVATDITERRELQAALAASEHKYRSLHENMRDGFAVLDMDGLIVEHNNAFRDMLGYSDEEIARLTYHDITPQQWHAAQARIMAEQVFTRGYSDVYEKEYRRADGSVFPVSLRSYLNTGALGQPARIWAIVRDMTQQKQAEEALLKSERLARKLLESMHGGVWAVDANRRTTFVNERLCAMLGYSTAELMNMSPLDVLEWPQRHTVDIRFHERESGVAGASDYVLVRKDGSRFPAHVMSSPIMEAQGAFEGLVCGVVDLTERARMEHELRRNQARFEALYELSRLSPATEQELAAFSLREAIRLTDSAAGVLFFVSPDGQSLEPKAWEIEDFIVGDLVPNFPSSGPLPWALVLQSGQPLVLNDFSGFEGLVPPGHPAITRFLGVPALNLMRTVAVLGLTGKATPYTAEDTLQSTLLLDGMWRVVRARRDEERIRASLREKDALLHEVHHRVKNNLQVIASLLDMSGRRLASPEARLSLFEVRGKVQAMSLIHAQLHSAVSPGGISLERFVRALFNQLQEVYAEGLDMTLQLQLGNLTLGLDQAVPLGLALNEALANVFKHACQQDRKAEGLASRVEIRATRDEADGVTLEVRDNGPGLPAGLDPAQANSLGMKLMFGLIRHQLRGELDFADAEPGVSVRIRFRSFIAK